MKKLSTKQWILITLAIMNLICLVCFIIFYSPILENNYYALLNESNFSYLALYSLVSGIIQIFIVFFMFLITDLFLYFFFYKQQEQFNKTSFFIKIFSLIISILFFIVCLIFFIESILQKSLDIPMLLACVITSLITSIFYVSFFIYCLIGEIKLKKKQKFIKEFNELN